MTDKMTKQVIITDPERLEYVLRQAKATFEIEGSMISKESEEVVKAVLSGEMTKEALIARHKKTNS